MIVFILKRLAVAIPTLLVLIVALLHPDEDCTGLAVCRREGDTADRDEQHLGALRARQARVAAAARVCLQHRLPVRFRTVLRLSRPHGERDHRPGLPGDVHVRLLRIHPRGADRRERGHHRRHPSELWLDYLTVGVTIGAQVVPNFVLAPILVLVFTLWLQLASGRRLERRTMELCDPARHRAGDVATSPTSRASRARRCSRC